MEAQITAPDRGPLRVVLADAQPAAREGLAAILDCAPDLALVGVVEHSADLLALLHTSGTSPTAIVLDAELGAGPVALLEQLRVTYPGVAILLICPPQCADVGLRTGAAGVVLRTTPVDSIVEAIRAISHHQVWIDPAVQCRFTDVYQMTGPRFSSQEIALLQDLAAGYRTREIEVRLQLTPSVFSRAVQELIRKLGARSRAHAVALALRQGVII